MTTPLWERRRLLQAGMAAPLVSRAQAGETVGLAGAAKGSAFSVERLMADVRQYADFGNKRSGGLGDRKAADWVADLLLKNGFQIERQDFETPYYNLDYSELICGDEAVQLGDQLLTSPTADAGLSGPLRLAETQGRLDGAIALINLPYRRWSSLLERPIQAALEQVWQRGAAAALLVTTGPSGEALCLNRPVNITAAGRPIAIVAPKKARALAIWAQSGRAVTLRLTGEGGQRTAQNIIGRIDRGADAPWLVVSTPRSGWTDCVGERGAGVAIWLALAEWMPRQFRNHSLLFVCNSGHEYENLGAGHLVEKWGPPPSKTDLWLHLGANAAARDWHETAVGLMPLPSVDGQRFLLTSDDIVELARAAFRGQAGLEMAYPSSVGAAGELAEIIKAGYPRHAGIFGAHRFHHAMSDNFSTVAPQPLAATANGFRDLLLAIL